MNIISCSGGNDSIALMQWAFENKIPDVKVVYLDTGWAAPSWEMRKILIEGLSIYMGFEYVCVRSKGMAELVRQKKGFPSNQHQFCTAFLKGIPFLEWANTVDPECKAVVLIGKRRAESEKRKNTPEFIHGSEYHDGRTVWHPPF